MSQRSEKLRRQVARLQDDVDALKRERFYTRFAKVVDDVQEDNLRRAHTRRREAEQRARRAEQAVQTWRRNVYLALLALAVAISAFVCLTAETQAKPDVLEKPAVTVLPQDGR